MGYARLIVNILFTNSTKICMRGCSSRKLRHYALCACNTALYSEYLLLQMHA